MGKLKKLIKNPLKFIHDSKFAYIFSKPDYKEVFEIQEIHNQDSKSLAICIGFNPWKRDYFKEYLPDFNLAFVRGKTPPGKIIQTLQNITSDYTVFIWSYKETKGIYNYLKRNNISIHRVEDGFIRSVGLGSDKTKPLSLVIDDDSLYFNSEVESKLEKLILKKINKYSNQELQYSRNLINKILEHKISKYNFIDKHTTEINHLIDDHKKTILVIGQVEKDMSIRYGFKGEIDNLELLEIANQENENATILFKPHPDVLKGNRKNATPIEEYKKISTIVPQDANLHNLIEISDHIYTITSLSGFEALLYGKKVTCLGSPFYAHWGLTDDRQSSPHPRKKIKLTIEELVYSVLIDYPLYLNGSLEKTIEAILSRKSMRPFSFENKFSFYSISGDYENTIGILSKLQNKKIALITSNSNIKQLYLGLNHDASVDVFTTTNNIENIIRNKSIVNPQKCKFLVKAYLSPLNELEKHSLELAQKISRNYYNIIKNITSTSFEDKESEIFSQIISNDLEDRIFNDCVCYLSMEHIAKDYDYIIYNHDYTSESPHLKLFKASWFKDKVYIPYTNSKDKTKIQQLTTSIPETKLIQYTKNKVDKIKLSFQKIWNEAKYNYTLTEDQKEKKLVLCANITDKNYAYYPSAQEIFKLSKQNNLNICLLPSIYVNNTRYDSYKQIMLEETGLKINTSIAPLFLKDILSSNNKLGLKLQNNLSKKIILLLEHQLMQELPDDLYTLILPSIQRNIDEFAQHCSVYFRLQQYMTNANMFITTMERAVISRLATLAASKLNIKTIGIQPQVISTSKRYRIPLVDKMLVIDPLQEENFINLGYSKNKIVKVGSANLRKHQKLIEEAEIPEIIDKNTQNILFIMQHSMPEVMYKCIESLKIVDESYNIFLKPHPFQENSVLSSTKSIISNSKNITLLDKDADTYQYIKHSNIITGLFSSAIYEAILANKDVIVLKLESLDPSIDFARFRTCIEVFNVDELQSMIHSFMMNTEQAKEIRNMRNKYISNNMYIYTTEKLTEQILLKDK